MVPKQIVDTKIAMSQSAARVMIDAVNIACGKIITTVIEMIWLLKPMVYEVQEGGLGS